MTRKPHLEPIPRGGDLTEVDLLTIVEDFYVVRNWASLTMRMGPEAVKRECLEALKVRLGRKSYQGMMPMTKTLDLPRPFGPAYTYRATVRRVYDGDTMTVDIDLGFGVILTEQTLRLYGIDTPEVRGIERPDGIAVRDHVRELCPTGRRLVLQTLKDTTGKFGRWLAIIWRENDEVSLNEYLVDQGMADVYLP